MTNSEKKIRDPYIGLLLAMVIVVFFLVVGAFVAYRVQFDGGLADKSSEWSNFGSYLGGILGPVVSLATLVAVLKTIYIQRELLTTQQHEFGVLMIKQDEQLMLARSEAGRAKTQAYQAALLNVIAGFAAEFRYDANEKLAAAEKLASSNGKVLDRLLIEQEYRDQADISRKKIAALTILSLDLSVNEFDDIEGLRGKFVPEMLEILGV
jgi:hypothetical protein